MKRRYPSVFSEAPEYRQPKKRTRRTRKELERAEAVGESEFGEYYEKLADLFESFTGISQTLDYKGKGFGKLRTWGKKNPDKLMELGLAMRELNLEEGKKRGWTKIEDYPEDMALLISEGTFMMAGEKVQAAMERVSAESKLHLAPVRKRIEVLEQVVEELNKVVELLLDTMEPERSAWLAFVEPSRADLWRVAQNLRRELRLAQ